MTTVEKQGQVGKAAFRGHVGTAILEIGSIVVNYVHTISVPVCLLLAAYGAPTPAISLVTCCFQTSHTEHTMT